MSGVGNIPSNMSSRTILNSIGENVMLLDRDYTIIWANTQAAVLLQEAAPLFHMSAPEEFIGVSIHHFYDLSAHQLDVMNHMQQTRRTRITIKQTIVADIIITPLQEEHSVIGFVVMLMDVTSRAEEEKRKEAWYRKLSIPIVHIWDRTIALPLIGEFNEERAGELLHSLLEECSTHRIEYVILNLGAVYEFEDRLKYYIQRVHDSLKLLGTQCIVVGMNSNLAMTMGKLDRNIPTFPHSKTGLKYVMKQMDA